MEKNSKRKSDYSLPLREGGGMVFSIILLLLSACHSSPTLSPEEEARRDSAALHVALMPVADCLPFYVAAQQLLPDLVMDYGGMWQMYREAVATLDTGLPGENTRIGQTLFRA